MSISISVPDHWSVRKYYPEQCSEWGAQGQDGTQHTDKGLPGFALDRITFKRSDHLWKLGGNGQKINFSKNGKCQKQTTVKRMITNRLTGIRGSASMPEGNDRTRINLLIKGEKRGKWPKYGHSINDLSISWPKRNKYQKMAKKQKFSIFENCLQWLKCWLESKNQT